MKLLLKAVQSAAEARGFAKGLEAAALEADLVEEETPAHSEARRITASNIAHRIRALAPKAPPEVAAAEPKP